MAETYKDPVCDMEVTPETAAGTSEYKGKTYTFAHLDASGLLIKTPRSI